MERSHGREGLQFGGLRIASLFADDVVLMAPSFCDLQHSLDRFAAECELVNKLVTRHIINFINCWHAQCIWRKAFRGQNYSCVISWHIINFCYIWNSVGTRCRPGWMQKSLFIQNWVESQDRNMNRRQKSSQKCYQNQNQLTGKD